MEYELITDIESLEKAYHNLIECDVVAVDTETTGLDPFTSRVRLIQFATEQYSYIIDCFKISELSILNNLFASVKPIKIFHNAKFDIKMLKYHFNFEFDNIFDTMLASQIISAGLPAKHNLREVTNRYLNKNVDKSEQRSDWSGELSDSQLRYAIEDVKVLLPLREKLRELIINEKLVRVAKLEFDCCIAVSEMELNGCKLDEEKWMGIQNIIEKKHEELSLDIQKNLSASSNQLSLFEGFASININSSSQLVEALNNMGILIKDSSEKTLIEHKGKHEVIDKILEYRGLQKALSSYGKNIVEHINTHTKRIHADFNQLRTDTGRFSCSNPNLQQIPATEEYRSCFVADTGNKLVIADYSQVELRILAELSKDVQFIRAFESGEDLHKATASSMFGVPIEEVTKEMRTQAKSINFGLAYGRGAGSLSLQINTSIEEAKQLINIYFQVYSGIKNWLYRAGQDAIKNEYSRTLSNRLRKYSFDKSIRSEVATIDRQGKNSPIQGTSADITKQALILISKSIKGTPVKLINTVHDEIILETPIDKAEWAAKQLEEDMVNAAKVYMKKVPIVVDVHIADYWKK